MPVANENVGVAFALVTGAGAATAVGASVVFFPALVKLTSKRVLASALGISAGVMFYVSFVEIFNKSILSFEDGGETPERAYIFSTLWFFGGVVVMLVSFLLRFLALWATRTSNFHPYSHFAFIYSFDEATEFGCESDERWS